MRMLDKKVYVVGIALLASVYEKMERVATDKLLADLWYRVLSDLSDEAFQYAIENIVKTSKFPPSIAEIRSKAQEFCHRNDLTAEEAWSVLYKDIRQKGWYHEPTYSDWKLEAAKNALGWENLCNMETTQVGVFRAQFMRIYDSLGNREKTAEIVQDKNIVELVNQLKAELAPQSKKALPEHDRK